MGRRTFGIALTVLIEGLLILLLLTAGPKFALQEMADEVTTVLNIEQAAEPDSISQERAEPEEPPSERPAAQATPPDTPRAPDTAQPDIPTPPRPDTPKVDLTPSELGKVDIASLPSRIAPPSGGKAPVYGPPAPTSRRGDSEKVGARPNGDPIYAAAWYREPGDHELAGYLSTANGPGWGQIVCRTVADFRVEDCEAVGEYPSGSKISRAILAAAWQFRVRPPRIGGASQVGSWVQIRIIYGNRP